MRAWWLTGVLAVGVSCFAAACGDDEQTTPPTSTAGGAGGAGGAAGAGGFGGAGGPLVPGTEFDRFCREQPWDASLVPATVGELGASYLGVIADPPLPAGTLETMKIVPEHPFQLTTIRVAFGGAAGGPARIRVMTTFGRGYPGGWPDIDTPEANLIEPIEIEVPTPPDPEAWIELDVSTAGLFLEPTQHYLLVYEQLGEVPQLAIEELAPGDVSRAMLHVPDEFEPYGLEGNFRMEAAGQYFCSWAEADRWFGEEPDTAFSAEPAGVVQFADLDGDGHDDVVLQAPGPKAYFGDGTGAFAAPAFDPFVEIPTASLVVLADVDNDGDRDLFAATYVGVNGDGDTFTILEGDCDDADAAVRPNATEVTNGKDDDCDGVADDGTDTSDADEDGVTIAAGDCNDTRDDVFPGAPELLDGRDNDCDGTADDDFVNHVALNDGQGHFTVVPNAGVETIDPSSEAAFGDGNADGWLDLYWGNWLERYPNFPAVQDRYVTGNGDGTFVDATEAAGLVADPIRPCYGVAWNDYDNDGHQDIYVSNYQLSNNLLWRNQGDGTFLDVAAQANVQHDDIPTEGGASYPGGHSYAAAFGDLDLDGDVDFFLANLSHPRTAPWADPSQLYLNGGAPDFVFENRREQMGILYDEGDVNAALADIDNDTYLDLLVAATYPTHYLKLYRNEGGTGFTDVTYEAGLAVHSADVAAFADVNEDGAIDLLVKTPYGPPHARLFINRVGLEHGWVELELEGTNSNRDAIGARATVVTGAVSQIREARAGEGNHLQHSHLLHFGLGDASSIDAVTVRWVGGATETISGISPGGRYRVVEGSGQGVAF